jgi:endonuclease YncB( thermonuclease family)
LVKAGFAWWYSQYAPHDTSLEKLETIARSAKIGLWVDKNPEAPWEWRKKERTK